MSLSVHVSPPVWADDATAKGVLKVCESVDEDLRLCLDRSSDSDSQLELNQSLSELIESITVPEDECGEDTVAEPPCASRGCAGSEIVADIVERILSRVEETAASAPRRPSAKLTGAREIDCSRSRDKSRHRRADSPKRAERRKRDRSDHERKKLRRRSTSCSTTSSACSSLSRKHRRKHKHHRRKDEGEGETEVEVEVKAPCPRVNPIFLWVKQDDTRIVEVLCEDYDKRNRIRLTKTAHGWRATPRTERLDSTLSKTSLDSAPTIEDLPPLVTSYSPDTKEKHRRGPGTRRRRRKRCDRKKVNGIKHENTYVNNDEHVDVVNNNYSSVSNNNNIKIEKELVTEASISEPRLRSFGYKKTCHSGPKLDSKSKKKDNKKIADIDIYDFVSTPKTESDVVSEDPDSGSESELQQENDLKIKAEPKEEVQSECEESRIMPEFSNCEVKLEPLPPEYSVSTVKVEEKPASEIPQENEHLDDVSQESKEKEDVKHIENVEEKCQIAKSETVLELENVKEADSQELTEKEEDQECMKEPRVEILKIPQPPLVLKNNSPPKADSSPEPQQEEKQDSQPSGIDSTKDLEGAEESEKTLSTTVPDTKMDTSNDKDENKLQIETLGFEEESSIEEAEGDPDEDDDTLPDVILPEPHLQTPEPSPQPVPEPSSIEPESTLTNLSLQPETSLDSDTIHLPDTTTKSDTASLINNDLSLGEKLSIKTDSEISMTPSLLTPGSLNNDSKPVNSNTSIDDLKTAKMIQEAEIARQISADLDEDHLLAIEEILQGEECVEDFDDDDLPEEYHGTHESPVNLVIDLKAKDQVDNIGIPLSLRTDDFLEIFPSPLSIKEHSEILPTLPTTKSAPEKLIPHAHQQNKTKFLESILSCNKKSQKEGCKKVDTSDQLEPLYLGVSRKSASPTVSSSDGRKFSSPDLEPKPKRMKVDDITLKTILNRNKDTVTKTKVHKSKDTEETQQTADSTTKSRLLELLTNENEEHISKLDPLTQLKEILSDPELTVPDPLLVPRSRLPALVANPAKEIPRLIALKSESLSYPKLLTDPDLLVVSLSHLQSLLQAAGKEEEMLKYQQQAQLLQHQMKQDQTASNLDAATATALNQMMWLPYLSQLEAATMTCGGNSQDFMTMLNMLFPSGSYPQMNPYMMTPTSPGINAYDYKSQLEFQQAFALWNEAMMQAATNQFAAQSLSGAAATTTNNNLSKLYQNYQDTKFNPKSNSNTTSKHLETKHAAARTSPITPNYQQSKYRSSQYPYTSMFSIPTSTPTTTTSTSSSNNSLYRTTQSYSATTQAQNSYHTSRARDYNYSTYSSLRTPTHPSSSHQKSDHVTVSAMSNSDLYKTHQRNSTSSSNSNCKSLMNILSKPLPKQTEVKTSSYPSSKVYPTSTTMLPKETTIRLAHPTPSSARPDPPKLKVKQPQHLVDPNSKPKLFNFDEHGEVGSTTGSLTPQVDETHPNLWHPLFSRYVPFQCHLRANLCMRGEQLLSNWISPLVLCYVD